MRRVASSKLVTEACALTSCLSDLEWWMCASTAKRKLNNVCAHLAARETHLPPLDHQLRQAEDIQGACIVDSKSLYDVVRKAALQALSASDVLRSRKLCIRWQLHEWNISDPVTKLHGR
eukprot:2302665-Amphidinium_carterae.5